MDVEYSPWGERNYANWGEMRGRSAAPPAKSFINQIFAIKLIFDTKIGIAT